MTKFLWFTGLSGSGKTTLAEGLERTLKSRGQKVHIIDGDVVREKFNRHLGFSPADIEENNRYVIRMCREIPRDIKYVIISLISPFRRSREEARNALGKDFIEIYLNCPYEECKRRDTKGLYKKAEKGDIKDFIGLHVPYEPPMHPEIEIDTVRDSTKKALQQIMNYLK